MKYLSDCDLGVLGIFSSVVANVCAGILREMAICDLHHYKTLLEQEEASATRPSFHSPCDVPYSKAEKAGNRAPSFPYVLFNVQYGCTQSTVQSTHMNDFSRDIMSGGAICLPLATNRMLLNHSSKLAVNVEVCTTGPYMTFTFLLYLRCTPFYGWRIVRRNFHSLNSFSAFSRPSAQLSECIKAWSMTGFLFHVDTPEA